MIYADVNGSSQLCKRVQDYLIEQIKKNQFANPNSAHRLGEQLYIELEKSRKTCANILGAEKKQVVFNSGSTEATTTVFHSAFFNVSNFKDTVVITSNVEHSAVYENARALEQRGTKWIQIQCDSDGNLDLDQLKSELKNHQGKVKLVSIMAANNETGIIFPFNEITKICQEYKAPFFSDTTQYIGKGEFNFNEVGLDFACMSGHKIGAPTGCGLLLLKDPKTFHPLLLGGGQENGLRAGTQNVIGIASMACALESYQVHQAEITKLIKARANFENKLKLECPEVLIVGEKSPRLPGTSLIAHPGLIGANVQRELERQEIFVTTSSACSDSTSTASRVITNMGLGDTVGASVVRVSICCHQNPDEKYSKIFQALSSTYSKLKGKAS